MAPGHTFNAGDVFRARYNEKTLWRVISVHRTSPEGNEYVLFENSYSGREDGAEALWMLEHVLTPALFNTGTPEGLALWIAARVEGHG